MSLFPTHFVCLDTESSGFLKFPWANVIELAGVLLDVDGEIVDEMQTLVRPPDPLPSTGRAALEVDKALAISGIRRAELETAPSVLSVHAMWSEWLDEHEVRWVSAYNVSFDKPMCEDRLGLRKMQWAPCIMERAMEIMGPAGALDPSDPSHYYYDPARPWLFPPLTRKLRVDKAGQPILDADGNQQWKTGAADFFGVPYSNQDHRALNDARLAAGVVCAIRRKQLAALEKAA